MARNRQRAKERQARRKAERQAATAPRSPSSVPSRRPSPSPTDPPELSASEELRVRRARRRTWAPPRACSSTSRRSTSRTALEHYDPGADHPEEDGPAPTGPRGIRGGDEAEHKDRSRVVQFLYAVVAELRRVQWPDRQALTTLTGVVLGFVVIAGGYLGLLDAIFSRVIQAIL